MTDATTGIDAGIARAPEARRAETGPTREQALTAFNSSFAFFEAATELTPQQEAARERIREAKGKTLDRGKDSRRTTLVDAYGKRHHPVEYVPVDDLLEFLIGQAEKGDLSPEQKDEISENIRILNKVSKDYLRLPGRLDPLIFNAKVQDEYKRIQADSRLTSGDDLQDYEQAAANINKRRELILPKENTSGTTPAPESVPADGTAIALAAEAGSIEDLASAPASAEILPPVFATLTPEIQQRLLQLIGEGHSDEDITRILRAEGIDLAKAVRLSDTPPAAAVADTPAPEPDLVPAETALPEPAEAAEKPIEITDFHLGMNFIDISSGDMVYVSNIHEKSYVPELADLTENEVTLTNLRTGETQTIGREKLLEQIRKGEGFKPDPIEGRKYRDTKTGKILTAQTDFKDGRPRVNLVDETGKIVGTGKRDAFDVAVADGDYEIVTPTSSSPTTDTTPPTTPPGLLRRLPSAPPPPGPTPIPTPVVSLTSPGALPAVAPALPPAPFAPATPGITPATPSPAPAPIEALAAEAPVAPEPTDDADVETEGPPTPPTVEEVREYLFMIASRSSDVSKRARELAEEHLRTEMRRGSILNPLNWKRKIGWRMVEHGMRQHFTERARRLLVETGNTYADIDLARNAVRNANANRGQEYQAGLAKAEAIKSGEITARSGLVHEIGNGPLRDAIMSQIIRPAVDGTLTDISRVQEILKQFVIDNQSDAQVNHVFGTDATQFGELADYFATDLLETSRQISEDRNAGRFAMDQLDRVVKIQLANARWGANSEMAQSNVDRFVQWTQSTRLKGTILNPAVIGAGISLATYGLTAIPGAAMRTGTALPLVGAIPAAFYGAARRAHDLRVDITTHRIERTYNSSPLSPNADRRRGLEQFSYLTASVNDLRKGYSPDSRQPRTLGGDTRGFEELKALDLSQEGNRNALMRRMADARARLDFAYGDILTFDSRYEVEQGRLAVIKDIAEATTALRDSGMNEADINSAVSTVYSTFQAEFIDQARAQERAFSGGNLIERYFTSFRAKEALKSGAFAGAVGVVGGIVSQQALATGFRAFGVNARPTILENIVGAARASEGAGAGVATLLTADTPLVDSRVGGHRVSIPQGTEWAKGSDGKLNLQLKDGGKTLLEDVRFDKKGSIHFDKDSILADEVKEGRERISRKDVLGKNGLWKEAATDVDRREWYRYNTPGHYEKNELRFTTGKKGNAVILSLEGMGLGREHGLHPNPIDVKELRDKGFFISLGGHSDKPIWVPVGADGHMDGKVRLDPDDYKHFIKGPKGEKVFLGDIAKMVINQEALGKLKDGNIATELYGRRDVFSIANNGRNGAIEAGRLIRRDGQNVAQIFATILGSEEVPDQIRTFSPSTLEINPTDIKVPSEGPGPLDIPPIVLPFAPRYPLEPLRRRDTVPWEYFGYPPEYGLGYPERGGDSVESYINWLKARGFYPKEAPYVKNAEGKWINADGTEITRDIDRERASIREYLASKGNPEHLKFISSLPEMDPECRVAVVIPAYNEGKNIYHTLREWSQQVDQNGNLVSRSTYEINIIINGPVGYKRDNTLSEILRFKKDNPDVKVNYIDLEIAGDGNIGLARKIMTDVTLQRSINRTSQSSPLYLESEDADLMEIDRRAVSRIISKFDTEPHLDALRGKQDLTPTILMQNDYLFFDRRVDRFVEYLLRDYRLRPDQNENYDFYWNRNITGGWNTAYTAEAYAMIGGYQEATVGEDVDIGRRISVMRGARNTKGKFIPNVTPIGKVHNSGQSNPRRFILALIKKQPAYADFTNKDFNEEMRRRELQDMLGELEFGSRISEENKERFEEIVTRARRFLGWKVADPNMQEILFSRMMLSLGFKKFRKVDNPDGSISIETGSLNETGLEWKSDYHINPDGSVKIDNIENLRVAFEEYRLNPKGQREDLSLPNTNGRVNTALSNTASRLRTFESNARNLGRTPDSSLLDRTIAPAGNLWASVTRPIRAGAELGARITRPRTTAPVPPVPPTVPPVAPPPAPPTPAVEPEPAEAAIPVIPPPTPPIRTSYTGPEPRASGRLTPEWRARQMEIDRENALARRTGRALNSAAANVSTTLASGARKTGEVTVRAGKAAARTGAQVASTTAHVGVGTARVTARTAQSTARLGAKTASGVALGIGQTAERIPPGVIDTVSPLASVGYGGGIIPRVTPTTPSPAPTPIEVAAPIPDSAETTPSKTYSDEAGQNYELIELNDHGARVKYPDGVIHYVPKNLFDLYTSGEFFNPNAVLPPTETPPTAPVTTNPVLQTTTPIPGPGSPKRITNDQALKRSVEILDSAQQRAKGWQPTSTLGKIARAGAIATTIGAKRKATLARLTGFVKPDNPPDDDSN